MLNVDDQQALSRASHSATFLVNHLRNLLKSSNPMLSEITREILPKVEQIDQLLQRIDSTPQAEDQAA